MDKSIHSLLTRVYELEGLLLVADKHGDDTPAPVYEALADKARKLADEMEIFAGEHCPEPSEPAMVCPLYGPVPPLDDPVAPYTEPEDGVEPEPEPEAPQPEPEDAVEPEVPEPEAPQPDPEPVALVYGPLYREPESEPEPETPTIPTTPTAPEDPLRVDEKLQRHLSKDIRSALSINDRFRFRRELFGGSDTAMAQAFDAIEQMNSYADAEQYFIDRLGWNTESDEVAEFMALVRRHFS